MLQRREATRSVPGRLPSIRVLMVLAVARTSRRWQCHYWRWPGVTPAWDWMVSNIGGSRVTPSPVPRCIC